MSGSNAFLRVFLFLCWLGCLLPTIIYPISKIFLCQGSGLRHDDVVHNFADIRTTLLEWGMGNGASFSKCLQQL